MFICAPGGPDCSFPGTP